MNVRKFVAALLVSAAVLLLVSDWASAQERTWTDATGAFTVDAEFVSLVDGNLRLKRADGQIITVALTQLSSADQAFAKASAGSAASEGPATVMVDKLTGESQEIKNDDGKPAGKKSFPRGIASAFKSPSAGCYVTSIRIHGGRYGMPQPPKEDFHVSFCNKEFKLIADFTFPYSKFKRADPDWVSLRLKPTKVPQEFVVCLNFNPGSTKGVFVSHDEEGKSLVGLPDKPAGSFSGGDWMIRPQVDTLKSQ